MCNGIYAAAFVLPATQLLAVWPVATQIPLTVPRAVGGLAQCGGKSTVFVGALPAKLDKNIRKSFYAAGEKPRKPHALAENGAHAVVPVAAAEVQQPVAARAAA